MNEDRFLDRVRSDARGLKYEIDGVATNRLSARIRARLDQPASMSQFIAAWFRPLAASLTALALATGIGITIVDRNQTTSLNDPIEYSIGGEVYSVAE